MKKFWNRWSQVILSAVWLTLLVILGVFNIVTAKNDNLYLWLLGANFGLVCADMIREIKYAIKQQ